MKLIEKLLSGIQPYTLHPKDYQLPVGFQKSKLKIHKQGDYFENIYSLLMVSPQYKKELVNSEKYGHYFSLQRALLCLITSQGSFFRDDERVGPLDPNFKVFRPILNSSNYQVEVLDGLENVTDFLTSSEFVKKFNAWVSSKKWEKDFPSFKFLHDTLVKIFNRTYGLATMATSPHKKVLDTFTARCMRDPENIHVIFENFLTIKMAIENKIFEAKFDICEIQYGFEWNQIGPKWFLEIKILFALRNFNTRKVLLNILTNQFKNKRGLLHSRTFDQEIINVSGISQISNSTPSHHSSSNQSVKSGSARLFDSLPTSPIKREKSPDFDSEDDENFSKLIKMTPNRSDRAPSNPCSFDLLEPTQKSLPKPGPNLVSNSPKVSKKRPGSSKVSESSNDDVNKENKLSGSLANKSDSLEKFFNESTDSGPSSSTSNKRQKLSSKRNLAFSNEKPRKSSRLSKKIQK